MKNIESISGLTVERVEGKQVVKFNGEKCPLIKRDEVFCKQNTSHKGEVLDCWETYKTPIGVVIERHYWARGGGLERVGTDWRIIPMAEIESAQKRFTSASLELAAARLTLEMFTEI